MKTLLILTVMLVISAGTALAQNWQEITVDGFTLRWATIVGNNLAVELSAPTTGWVSVGFDPTQQMLNANIIIGYVDGTTTVLRDDFGWQNTSHKADTVLGGTTDVTVDGGSETSGTTQIEFTIPLDSGDSYDRPLMIGSTYPVIFARGANGEDNFSSPHVFTSSSTIDLIELDFEPYTWTSVKASDW